MCSTSFFSVRHFRFSMKSSLLRSLATSLKQSRGFTRELIVWNIPAVGCTPVLLSNASIRNNPDAAYSAETGCLEGVNALVNQTNALISAALQQLRVAYKKIRIFEADIYTLFYNVQQNPQAYGFTQGFLVCCGSPGDFGYNFNATMFCGLGNTVLCSDPSEYVWWDGIHSTDALNELIITRIPDGSILTPSVNKTQQWNAAVNNVTTLQAISDFSAVSIHAGR